MGMAEVDEDCWQRRPCCRRDASADLVDLRRLDSERVDAAQHDSVAVVLERHGCHLKVIQASASVPIPAYNAAHGQSQRGVYQERRCARP